MSTIEVPVRTARPGQAARGRVVLWLALVGAYVASFFLPAYFDLPAESNPYPGDATVVRGWGAFLQGLLSLVLVVAGFIDSLLSGWSGDDRTYWLEIAALSWLANPAFWIGLRALRRRRWRTAAVAGLAALVLALLALVLVEREIGQLFAGYFVWLGGIVLLTAAGFAGLLSQTAAESTHKASRPEDRAPSVGSEAQADGTPAPSEGLAVPVGALAGTAAERQP
jgi:hypothetical protein